MRLRVCHFAPDQSTFPLTVPAPGVRTGAVEGLADAL